MKLRENCISLNKFAEILRIFTTIVLTCSLLIYMFIPVSAVDTRLAAPGTLIPGSTVILQAASKATVVNGSSEELLTAVYAHCKYDILLSNAVMLNKGKDDGKMLTDLKYTTAKPVDGSKTLGWVMIGSASGNSDFSVTVTLDFGFVAKDVCRFYLRAFRSTELKAETPKAAKFYASEDGKNFEFVGNGTTLTDLSMDDSAAIFGVTLESGLTARYVRAVIECDGKNALWINEVGAAAMGNYSRTFESSNGLLRDSRGLLYRINNGKAEVLGIETESYGQGGILQPSDLSFDADNQTYYLGVGTGNEVKVISDFIGEGRPNYSGVPNNIKYIVIHNTATTPEHTDAEYYNFTMHNTTGEAGWHYTVDEHHIYHSLSDSIVGWHAGSSHNYESIGIEICVNGAPQISDEKFIFSGSVYDEWVNTRFRQSLKNTAVLVAELLVRYGLSTDAIIQHYDVTGKQCPRWMRMKDGKLVYEGTLWVEFMGYVKEYYALFNGSSDPHIIRPSSDVVIPDYITLDNGEVYPVCSVAASAFADKGEKLNSVFLGKMLERIGDGCFVGNASLKSLILAHGNTNFTIKNSTQLYDSQGRIIFDISEQSGSSAPNPKPDCRLDIRQVNGVYYIFAKEGANTLTDLANEYGATQFGATAMNGNSLSNNDVVGTGAVLFFDNTRFRLVVLGDADGNGIIDQSDCMLVKRAYTEEYLPLQTQIPAMAVNNGKRIGIVDYLSIKRHVLGSYDLTA